MPCQIDILSATPEVIFAALAQAEHELMDKTLRSTNGRSVPIWGLVLMSENFIPTSQDGKVMGRFFVYNKQMHPADFANDRTQWELRSICRDCLPDVLQDSGHNNERPMTMGGLLLNPNSEEWYQYYQEILYFPASLIEQAQQVVVETLDKYIHHHDSPSAPKGPFWGIEYFQLLKIMLQNAAFKSRRGIDQWLAKVMRIVFLGPPELEAAKMAILSLLGLRERAWGQACGEGEQEIMIKYCKFQRELIKSADIPNQGYKFRLDSLFHMILCETARGHSVSFANMFKHAERLFLVRPSYMHRYGIIADHNGVLRSDIAVAREKHLVISEAELSAAVEAQSLHLEQALQHDIRQLTNQLTSMKQHLALLGKRTIDQISGAVLHPELRMALAESRRVRRGPARQIARKDECYAIFGVDEPVDLKTHLPDFKRERECIRGVNAKFRKGPGYEQACKDVLTHIPPDFSIHNPYGCMQHDEYADLVQEPRPVQASQNSDHNVKSEAYSSMRLNLLISEDVIALTAALDGLSSQYLPETTSEPCEETLSSAPQAKRSLTADMEQEFRIAKDIVVDHSHEQRDTAPVHKPFGDRSNTLGSQQLQPMLKIRDLQHVNLDIFVEDEARRMRIDANHALQPTLSEAPVRISFKLISRKPALGMYQPPWMPAEALPRPVSSTAGGTRGKDGSD